jgi:hypothetical protein
MIRKNQIGHSLECPMGYFFVFGFLLGNEWEIQFHEEMIYVIIFHGSTLKRTKDTSASIQ